MSILDDDQDDFLRYLQEQGVEADRDSFVSRYHVSHYIEARYVHFCTQAKAEGIQHGYIRASARSISRLHDGTYRIELDNGRTVHGSDVLVCTGNGTSFKPESVRRLLGRPGLHGSLYPERKVLESLEPQSFVLVLGSRLSAIDSALLLCQAGHRVLLASPSGQLRIISAQPFRVSHEQGWVVEWVDKKLETFDATVCATGFSKPQWRATNSSLEWRVEQRPSHSGVRVTPDLRVCFDGAIHPERIWTIGIASHLAAPIVNSVYQTVRPAYRICHRWRRSSTPNE